MSAFFLYSQANRARVKAENPDSSFGEVVSHRVLRFESAISHLSDASSAFCVFRDGIIVIMEVVAAVIVITCWCVL